MKINNKLKYKLPGLALSLLVTIIVLTSCEEEDPFVDRTVSPVLIVFDDVPGYLAGGGLTATPSITKTVNAGNYTQPVILSLTVYELDKSGILDHTVGIDSIPVVGMAITFSKRDGTVPLTGETDAEGKAFVTTSWVELGVTDVATIVNATGAQSRTIPVSWRGEHKGQTFTRYAQVVLTKP
jgi:hypothetical protein